MTRARRPATVESAPIEGMRPGTSGLRKRTRVWAETPHYVENFAQAVVSAWRAVGGLPARGAGTLVVGGDGRYFNDVALQRVLRVLAGNGVAEVVVPVGGVVATPAASALVRSLRADGASQSVAFLLLPRYDVNSYLPSI